uniref:Retrotransposon protein, putative, unclassified n=1 Tax=Heterorhabditis bacteriophora TaxID=37862 RepID=A0A1I7XF65_HETBA
MSDGQMNVIIMASSRRRSHRLAVTESKQKEEQKKRVTRQRRSTVEDTSEMGKGDGVKIEIAELDEPKRRRGRPPTGSVSNPIRRRTNELDALLSMDFGPRDSGRRILDCQKRRSAAEREAQEQRDKSKKIVLHLILSTVRANAEGPT